jgi:hypothetical protein
MMNVIIGLGHTKTEPKTFYDDLDYWVVTTRIRPKSIYDNNNYWASSKLGSTNYGLNLLNDETVCHKTSCHVRF